MNHYEIWVNLKDSRQDMEFCRAVNEYLGYLRSRGGLESWRITRRKFGFGPAGLGEFHVSIAFRDLAQFDLAFGEVSTRTGDVERLHMPVYAMVTDFQSALYRDFPDPQRAES